MVQTCNEEGGHPAGNSMTTTLREFSETQSNPITKFCDCQAFDAAAWWQRLSGILAELPDSSLQRKVRATVDRALRSACTAEDTLPMPKPISQVAPDFRGVPWLWHGYIGQRVYTLLLGLWKSGKTTLIGHLLRAMATGGEFCGLPVKSARVLVVSEESEPKWAERRDTLGLGDNVHLICRPWRARPKVDEWGAFIAHLAGLVQENRYDLVVFDPISELWPVWDENDAGQVNSAMMPLHAIAEAEAGVLLVHHPNKSDASEGRASRGSGALTAFVDVILEFRRWDAEHQDRKRVLKAFSRYEDTPPELVIELTEESYKAVGTRVETERAERLKVLLEVLGDNPLTVAEVRASWPEEPRPSQRTIERDLSELARLGSVQRLGSGTKGDPYRFRILDRRQVSHEAVENRKAAEKILDSRHISHGAVENRIFILNDHDKAPELNIKAIFDSSKAYIDAVENSDNEQAAL